MTEYNWLLICKTKSDSELVHIIREKANPDEFIVAAFDELYKRGKVDEYKITQIDPLVRKKITRKKLVTSKVKKYKLSFGLTPKSVLTNKIKGTEEEIFKSIILATKELGYNISDIARNYVEIIDPFDSSRSRKEIKVNFENNYIRIQSSAPIFFITDFGFNYRVSCEFYNTLNDIIDKRDYIHVDQSMFEDLIYSPQGIFSTITEIYNTLNTCFSKTE